MHLPPYPLVAPLEDVLGEVRVVVHVFLLSSALVLVTTMPLRGRGEIGQMAQ